MCHAIYIFILNVTIVLPNPKISLFFTRLAEKLFVLLFLLLGREYFNINDSINQ